MLASLGTDYQKLIQQSQSASKALARQGKLLNVPNTGLSIARQIVQFNKHHPQAALAAVCAMRQETALSNPLPLKVSLMMAILTHRSRLNDHYAQHLIAGAFTLFSATTYHRDTHSLHVERPVLQGLRQHLQKPQLKNWRDILAVHKVLEQPDFVKYLKSPGINTAQWWLISCAHLALHFQQQFFVPLRQVARYSPAHRQSLINQWLAFPGDRWPAAQGTNSHERSTVMFNTGSDIALFTQSNGRKALNWRANDVTLAPTRSIAFSQWRALCEQFPADYEQATAFKPAGRIYPLNHPPASLLKVIDALSDPEVDIADLAMLIEDEPVFAHALKASASMDNRLNLPVHDVKQAVLTYGTERVGDMLVRQALMQRLTQHEFPLSGTCNTLIALTASLASAICEDVKCQMTPQAAGLISTFMLAPLYSLPALKVLLHFPHKTSALHSVDSLLSLQCDPPFSALATELAANWHQSKLHQALLRYCGKMPAQVTGPLKTEYALLCLSLLLARQWLHASSPMDDHSIEALRQCLHILPVRQSNIAEYKEKLSGLIYCHLLR